MLISKKGGNKDAQEKPAQQRRDTQPQSLLNTAIYDRYIITEVIGSGSSGSVYGAIDKLTKRDVAVKMLNESLSSGEAAGRFFSDARAIALLRHPNIVEMLDVGTYKTSIFFVTEYLRGMDLSKGLERNGKMDWELAKSLLLSACDAVGSAHDARIVHNNLRPSNIFLIGAEGIDGLKVLDFGLPLPYDGGSPLLKAIPYTAPELILKQLYDQRADVYSLGAVAYHMVCGAPPLIADGTKSIEAMLLEKAGPPKPHLNSGISEEAGALILRALAYDASMRYPTMNDMRKAVESCGKNAYELDAPSRARRDSVNWSRNISLERMIRPRPRFGAFIAGALVTAIAVGAGFAVYQFRHSIPAMIDDLRSRYLEKRTEAPMIPIAHEPARISTSEIIIDSDPSDASVYLMKDDEKKLLGTTPLDIRLPMGENAIMIVKKGYQPMKISTVREQAVQRFAPKLEMTRPGSLGADPINASRKMDVKTNAQDEGSKDKKPAKKPKRAKENE